MIKRDITKTLLETGTHFPAIALLGPRQSGKTTLVQAAFKNHGYVSLEDYDQRLLAQEDPRGFLKRNATETGIILDEIQHVPELLSYMQTMIDSDKKKGFFIITGSQNLLLNEAIRQTLAGRLAILTLYPLAIHELQKAQLLPESIDEAVVKGNYPRVYADGVPVVQLYRNYISGYVERDVRQIKNIFDLGSFQKFMQHCAARSGQLVNFASLADACGVDEKTIKSWITILEATYVVFLLQPYYKNFGKRLIKAPKLYFVDTGLACSLLNIKSAEELATHYLRGSLVETYIVSDLCKQFHNMDQKPTLYFWRDLTGNEIDCLIEHALHISPLEIKAGETVGREYFKQFAYLKDEVAAFPLGEKIVVYGGDKDHTVHDVQIISWRHAGTIISSLESKRHKKMS